MQVMFLPHAVQLRIVRHPLASAQLAGTPSKRGGTQIEGQVEQQQQRLRAAAHPLLARSIRESASCPYSGCPTRVSCQRTLRFANLLAIMHVELGGGQHAEWR
jgi:hypothetical protein